MLRAWDYAPALLSLHSLPGSAQRGGPKTQDFFSVANPTLLSFYQVEERKFQQSPAFELLKC